MFGKIRMLILTLIIACGTLGAFGAFGRSIVHADGNVGNVYYVDPNGNDANDGISSSTPWKTLNHAAQILEAGDTLLLRGGQYPDNWFYPKNSGQPGRPITLKAYNDEIPVIAGKPDPAQGNTFIYFENKSYFVVDGLHFENNVSGSPLFTWNADYVTVINCVFRNNEGQTQLNMYGSHNLVEHNLFDTTGDPLGDDGQGAGNNIYLQGASYTIVQSNIFKKGGHAALDTIDAGGGVYSHHNVIRNNYVDQGWGSGIELVRGSHNTLVENNVIKNSGIGATYPKTGIQIAADRNIVRNNIISGTGSVTKKDRGMVIESYEFTPRNINQNVLDNRVYNNVIYKSGQDAMFFSQRGLTQLNRNKFVNNIMYSNRVSGSSNAYWGTGNYYMTVETYHGSKVGNGWPYYPNENYFYNNLYLHADASGDHPGEDPLFYYDQENWAKSLADVQNDYPAYFHDNSEQNPGFMNADADDFSLKADSAAIDAGAHLAQTTAAGVNTTVVPVNDPWFFFDGYGITDGDLIQVGSNAPVRVIAVDQTAGTLTVASNISFAGGDTVDLAYNGTAPDMGANESGRPLPQAPIAPIQRSVIPSDGSATVNWNLVDGATGYKVLFGTESGHYTGVSDAGMEASKLITGLTNGTTYYFAVVAYNAGGESVVSPEKSTIPPDDTGRSIAAPALKEPVAAAGQITLSWSAVIGAQGYKVKYGTSTGDFSTVVDAGDVTTKTIRGLQNGITYFFVVTAYNAVDESIDSATKSAAPHTSFVKLSGTAYGTSPGYEKAFDGQTDTFFDNGTNSGGYTGIDLGADKALSVSKIRFYPRSGKESRMKGGKFQGSNDPSSGYVDLAVVSATPASKVWSELQVTNLNTYRYLRYLSPSGGFANVAEIEFLTDPDVSKPASPILGAPLLEEGQASFTWMPLEGVTGYTVKYGTEAGVYSTVIDAGRSSRMTVTDLVYGTRYYAAVTAYNEFGESGPSNEVSFMTPDVTPPIITYSGNAGTYQVDQTIDIRCAAVDALSGVSSSTCAPISGNAYDFPLGLNTFTASATDHAGNESVQSASFTVTVDPTSLSRLTERFVENRGIANSLVVKLEQGHVAAYINEVSAQSGKALTEQEAAILTALATAIQS